MIGDLVRGSIIMLGPVPRCMPMPTAIARIYIDQGFVVAADGRAQNSIDDSVDDNTQKIHLINESDIMRERRELGEEVGHSLISG